METKNIGEKEHKHKWKYGGISFTGMLGNIDEYCDCGAERRRTMHDGI